MRNIQALALACALASGAAFHFWGPHARRRPLVGGVRRPAFSLGVNYPWLDYGSDFGSSAWGHGGVSEPRERARLTADLARIRAAGAGTVRWFVMCDGRSAPEFDRRGRVTGFDNYFYKDLDAALDAARASGVRLVLVLFDYRLLDPETVIKGAALGGHAALLTDPQVRSSLFDHALIPLLKRYGSRPEIKAWEIMNEPEWRTGAGGVPWPAMRDFVGKTAALVHAYASQPVTVGSASSAFLPLWKGLGLDFYEYHYYPELRASLSFDPLDLKLDRPCVLGEFPTAGPLPPSSYLDAALRNGLAGAWAWSWRSGDAYSDMAGALLDFSDWRLRHAAVLRVR